MNVIEKEYIRHYHKLLSKLNGIGTPEALGWFNKTTQEKRFEILCQIGDLNNKTVLDVGCGYGDLKIFIDKIFSNVRYIGIDYQIDNINFAKNKFAESNSIFIHDDFFRCNFPKADYIFASGIFSYKSQETNYYQQIMVKMFAAAKIGIGVNFLKNNGNNLSSLLINHHIDSISNFCKSLSPNTHIIENYLYNDFTSFVLH